MVAFLEISALTKSFHSKEGNVINGIDLTVKEGSVISLLGESGSGKTTLARLIAGLEVPDSGIIKLKGRTIASDSSFVPPQKRNIGMVFQDYALFPHMTVFENIAYGIQNHGERELRVKEVLLLVGLENLKHRYPHQLSGGQQQRVALARALAPKPQLLLLDEPFSNLDASLKLNLRNELFEIIRKSRVTALFLTHDTQDAMAVADTIVVLKGGIVAQQGTATSLYENPNSIYIASLFGPLVELDPEDLGFFNLTPKSDKIYAIRQDKFQIDNKKLPYNLEVSIKKSTFQGNHYLHRIALPNNKFVHFTTDTKPNKKVLFGFVADSLLVFDDRHLEK